MRIPTTKLIWSILTLLLTFGYGCNGFGLIPGTPVDPNSPHASGVILYNCTVDNQPTAPPSGRAYNIFAQYMPDGGPATGFLNYGQLNALPTPTDCHTAVGNTVSVPFKGQAGLWEIRAVKIPRSGEPSCNSATVDGGCLYVSRTFFGENAAPVVSSEFVAADQ